MLKCKLLSYRNNDFQNVLGAIEKTTGFRSTACVRNLVRKIVSGEQIKVVPLLTPQELYMLTMVLEQPGIKDKEALVEIVKESYYFLISNDDINSPGNLLLCSGIMAKFLDGEHFLRDTNFLDRYDSLTQIHAPLKTDFVDVPGLQKGIEYGAQTEPVDIVAERSRCLEEGDFDALHWLYAAVKDQLTAEIIAVERAALLDYVKEHFDDDSSKCMRCLGSLYRAASDVLTLAFITSERECFMKQYIDIAVDLNGYGPILGRLHPVTLATDRAASLAMWLYRCGTSCVTEEFCKTERQVVMEMTDSWPSGSSWNALEESKGYLLAALYLVAVKNGVSGDFLDRELSTLLKINFKDHPIIPIGKRTLGPAINVAIETLIKVCSPVTVLGRVDDILDSGTSERVKLIWLRQVFRRAQSALTLQQVQDISTQLLVRITDADEGSNVGYTLSTLYDIGNTLITDEVMVEEREKILDSDMQIWHKSDALSGLYSASSAFLAREIVERELRALRQSNAMSLTSGLRDCIIDSLFESFKKNVDASSSSRMNIVRAKAKGVLLRLMPAKLLKPSTKRRVTSRRSSGGDMKRPLLDEAS